MKMTRITRPLTTLALMFSILTLASPGFAQEPQNSCKQECQNKHLGAVEALIQERPSPTSAPEARRGEVLQAIDALNNCVKACDLAPAPTPAPEPTPEPAPKRGKRG